MAALSSNLTLAGIEFEGTKVVERLVNAAQTYTNGIAKFHASELESVEPATTGTIDIAGLSVEGQADGEVVEVVTEGTILLSVNDTIAAADVGAPLYVKSDNPQDMTKTQGSDTQFGVIARVIATGALGTNKVAVRFTGASRKTTP